MADGPQEIVRAGDKDLFLATLFCPPGAQADLFALHAFHVEVNRIPRLVSEPQIGEIRLQWWLDALEAIGRGEAQDHPVAQALAGLIARHRLPIRHLTDFVEAKRHDLYADRFPDVTALEVYLGHTQSVFFQLAAMIAAPAQASKAADASGLGGVAFALARGLAQNPDRLLPAGMDKDTLVAHARQRLQEARATIAGLPRELFPVFLPMALADLYLDAGREPAQWRRQWRLWRAARSERV